MSIPTLRAPKVKPLTDREIRLAKPKEKIYRLSDGAGLAIKVLTSGSKSWEYRFVNPETGKYDTMIIGSYPEISLSQAREIHQDLRSLVALGVNPKTKNRETNFKNVFELWWLRWSETKSEKYAKQVKNAIERNCMSVLGRLDMNDIKPAHIAKALQPFEDRGVLEYLHRARSALNQVFSFALARGICEINPVMMVTRDAFKRPKSKNHRSLEPENLYQIVEFFDHKGVSEVTRLCTEFILRNILRIQEACEATWNEIDFHKKIFTIPEKRMKMRREHIIPLSKQSIEILKRLKAEYPHSKYIFPGAGKNGYINKETPRIAINRAGVDTTIHGFRHLASTILNESLLFKPDIIEAALAHSGKDQIRAVYNKAQYVEKRRELMQWWSDFIDKCDNEENNKKALADMFKKHSIRKEEEPIKVEKKVDKEPKETEMLLTDNLLKNCAKLTILGYQDDDLILGFYVESKENTAMPYIIEISKRDLTFKRMKELIFKNLPDFFEGTDATIKKVTLVTVSKDKKDINLSINIENNFN